uniref:hypothetical protein n=1 Tax=Alicyclobacillus tolerans TaxID=90970 RepID=UPI001F1C2772|nr:hypothetical protein [Alicyclobacillus tolerans]
MQQVAGFHSPIPKENLFGIYDYMSTLTPDDRTDPRLELLLNSTRFVSDVMDSIRNLTLVGVKGVSADQLYERITAKYGDRGTIPRRVRYALATLRNFGALEHEGNKWYLVRDLFQQMC